MLKRGSGILLHITSLPSPYGIGDLGRGAYNFVDFLSMAGQSFWQVLPLNPTCGVFGNSPYSSFSAFAGNPLLISLEMMVDDGFLSRADIRSQRFPGRVVSYRAVTEFKNTVLQRAYEINRGGLAENYEFRSFCEEHSYWLDDYCLFVSLKRQFKGVEWNRWPADLRDREKDSLESWRERLRDEITREMFFQFVFFNQWFRLRRYCEERDIQIIGDVPIYVNYDSADVWANSEVFRLDKSKKPLSVGGVPPDYFSPTGQLWGHPVYNWNALREMGYSWWIKRLEHNIRLFHLFRLDHFRGFVAYWEVRAGDRTAVNGKWVKAPAEDFFKTLFRHFTHLPMIAEDLGVITPDVREVMGMFGFPGMRVLMFAFGDDIATNPYAPHNHVKNCVVYTGTHDNNTIKGWFRKELSQDARKRLSMYAGRRVTEGSVHWELIRLAMMSVADMVIIPMQDFLGLGEWARMNRPASKDGNWRWRLEDGQLDDDLSERISRMVKIYGRM